MIRKGSAGHRVLVELAGQNRDMTVKELFEATDLSPETVHRTITDLGYGNTPYVKLSYNYGPGGADRYWITWEGQELLRRLDAPAPPVIVSPMRRHWWSWNRSRG